MSNGTGQHCANASYEGKNERSSAGKIQTKLPCSLRKESLANHQADLSTKTPPLMPTLYLVPWDQVSDTLHISTSISGLTKQNATRLEVLESMQYILNIKARQRTHIL